MPGHLPHQARHLNWRAITPGLLLAFMAGGILAMYRNAFRLHLVHMRVPMPGLRAPLRVVQMSDLHYGPYIGVGMVRRWVRLALSVQPDLVLITGDLVDKRKSDLDRLLRELRHLNAPLGVWAVWGNHDHGHFKGHLSGFTRQLADVNIRVLCNEGAPLRDDLYLAGVDDKVIGHPDVNAALRDWPDGTAALLMAHHPDVLLDVPPTVALTLCGHTHGAQIAPMGTRWLYRHTRLGAHFLKGWEHAPARGYVSSGLGTTFVPLRLNSIAELTVFDLLPVPLDPADSANPGRSTP